MNMSARKSEESNLTSSLFLRLKVLCNDHADIQGIYHKKLKLTVKLL